MRRIAKIVGVAVLVASTNSAAYAAEFKIGPMQISEPWTRVTPEGATVAAGFMKLTNTGAESETLVAASLSLARTVQIHEMSMDGDKMNMRELDSGLEIKPGQTVELRPGSLHIMFMNLIEPIQSSHPIKGTLTFKKSGSVEIIYSVVPLGAKHLEYSGSTADQPNHGGH